MKRTIAPAALADQVKEKAHKSVDTKVKKYDGNTKLMIHTGSTLLDLAISGGRIRGGGIPGGIFIEVSGPSSAGKTVVLCELAGDVQRRGGAVQFHDPEARLNTQFAKIFDFTIDKKELYTPDTVVEVFQAIRKWEPVPDNKKFVNATFIDSLAALSTELEMGDDKGDRMGMKRAKDFSQELRRTCRIVTKNNMLMVCSNQVRVNTDAGLYGPKYTTPGGEAIAFYASLRLRASQPQKVYKKLKLYGKERKRAIGVETIFEVAKSSIWKPYRTAPVIINFDYGIDDIRANLQFIKEYSKYTTYTLGGESLHKELERAIAMIEEDELEDQLKEEVIDLWEAVEEKFNTERKPKQR